jgi:hypothetical protein
MTRQQLEKLIRTTQDRVERERLLQQLHYMQAEGIIGPAVKNHSRSKTRSAHKKNFHTKKQPPKR